MSPASFPAHVYRHSGLTVHSALELPEWQAFALERGDTADVTIDFDGNASVAMGDHARSHVHGDTLSFTVDGVARWSITGGRAIGIAPFPEADDDELRLFTLGSAWAAMGYQRGLAMLHGSAVLLGKHAVMFCGDMEAGKSTMAAAMVERGHTLVSDDLARVDPPAAAGEAALIHPSAPRLKLWQEAIDRFGWQDRISARDHFRDAKFHLRPSSEADAGPAPLCAIVLLEWGDELRLERLAGADAVRGTIAAATFRPEMLDALGLHLQQAMLVSRILAATSVYRLVRPREFALLERSCDMIADLVRTGSS